MVPDADATVDAIYRSDWGRIVAGLIRLVGDFDVAEEAAQEAFTAAVNQWRMAGIPDNPAPGSLRRLDTRPSIASGGGHTSNKR